MTPWSLRVRCWHGRQPACRRLSTRMGASELTKTKTRATKSAKDLRLRCAQVINGLNVPHPFDLEKFRSQLERQRDRPLRLVPIQSEPDSPCGLWVAMAEADYIFYDAATSPLHQIHIIVHEIGHLLLDHRGAAWITDALAGALMPDLDPALIRRTLGRTVYTEIEEQEAETIATMLLERASIPESELHTEHVFDPGLAPEVAATMTRVATVFSQPHHA
jgi:hypothetical protein